MTDTKNKIGIILLVMILLLFSVGGYFLMEYMLNLPEEEEEVTEVSDVRIDTTKDYIYYENTEEIIEEIFKEDVVLNFKGLERINNTLHTELNALSSNVVTLDEVEVEEGTICLNDIYSFTYREYVDTETSDYVSLLITDYDYICNSGTIPDKMKSYVVNKDTGVLYTEEELLRIFNVSEDDIISKVRDRLTDTQVLEGEEQVIDIDGTIRDITDATYGTNKALTISKNGTLVINFIVKSNKINYNDSVELN